MKTDQMLRVLCVKTGWCYAVFWKLKRRSRMVLTWEDGYCNHIEPESVFNGLSSSTQKAFEGSLERQERSCVSEKIGLTVAKMSFQVYSLGEGIIGRVAFSGKHQWVFDSGEKANPTAPLTSEKGQNPSEWHSQFAAGIKTIAFIAVSQGVVQLGSTQIIREDLEWVERVRSMFGIIQGVPKSFPSSELGSNERGCGGQSGIDSKAKPVSLGTTLQEETSSSGRQKIHSHATTGMECNKTRRKELLYPHKIQRLPSSNIIPSRQLQSYSNASRGMQNQIFSYLPPPLIQREVIPIFPEGGGKMVDTRGCLSLFFENMKQPNLMSDSSCLNYRFEGLNPVTKSLQGEDSMLISQQEEFLSAKNGPPEVISRRPLKFRSYVDNVGNSYKLPIDYDMLFPVPDDGDLAIDCLDRTTSSCCISDPLVQKMVEESKVFSEASDTENNVVGPLDKLHRLWTSSVNDTADFVIGGDDELSQALGLSFQKKYDGIVGEEIPAHSSGKITDSNFQNPFLPSGLLVSPSGIGMSQSFTSYRLGKEEFSDVFGCSSNNKSDPLLDAVIEASAIPQSLVLGSNFSCEIGLSGIGSSISDYGSEREAMKLTENNASGYSQGCGKLEMMPCMLPLVANYEEKEESKSVTATFSTLMDESLSFKSQSIHSKKSEESRKTSRKRVHPGEIARPRPKDRQQIQDRVRELRDIIPNGSKCSIDSLLEKTIKHMLFLQNIAHHADVLKQTWDMKMQGDMETGTSGALECSDHGMEWPVIVESLNQPHQMLVEMFCKERGLFLQIADTIRSLGLTILKGFIESRLHKVWACFIVEARMEVHRLEIVEALMPLLQPGFVPPFDANVRFER